MPEGRIIERFLDERFAAARVECPQDLIPLPGQYLPAYNPASDESLATPIFSAGNTRGGFLAASPLPKNWLPGVTLSMRGPLGHGFHLPGTARHVALAALDISPAYLLGIIEPAQAQGASISLVCDDPPEDLPTELEIDPLSALGEICRWADYLAVGMSCDAMRGWKKDFTANERLILPREAQALVVMPMPCCGLAKCGVCSVETKRGVELACEDGPVFQLNDLV